MRDELEWDHSRYMKSLLENSNLARKRKVESEERLQCTKLCIPFGFFLLVIAQLQSGAQGSKNLCKYKTMHVELGYNLGSKEINLEQSRIASFARMPEKNIGSVYLIMNTKNFFYIVV